MPDFTEAECDALRATMGQSNPLSTAIWKIIRCLPIGERSFLGADLANLAVGSNQYVKRIRPHKDRTYGH